MGFVTLLFLICPREYKSKTRNKVISGPLFLFLQTIMQFMVLLLVKSANSVVKSETQ